MGRRRCSPQYRVIRYLSRLRMKHGRGLGCQSKCLTQTVARHFSIHTWPGFSQNFVDGFPDNFFTPPPGLALPVVGGKLGLVLTHALIPFRVFAPYSRVVVWVCESHAEP